MGILNDFSLEGKVALVTGASYGIGFAIATAYAQAGATIVFNDIKQELVDKGIASYKEEGIEAHGYVCDVTDEAAVCDMVKKIEEEVGVIDILVNNAGIIKRIPMLEMSADQFRQVIDVDLNAPFIVSKAVIPGMIKKGHGKIINICSMMSELGRETVSAYAAAKGGLKMLTRNIASEYGEFNIQCNGIGPGYIATPQTAPLRELQADGSRHPFDQFIIAKTPAARWGDTEDLKGPAVFLASDASNFVNGHVLYVDGGRFVMCLSDGMGSGMEACRESETVVELLEQFMESGFSQETAAKMVNSALVLKGEEGMFSTVDICAVDLYTGICNFLKAGAASTFIKRDHWVESITSESLAAGLVQQIDFETASRKLYHGDYLIMMTDGVLDALPDQKEEETMKEIIMDVHEESPKDFGRGILERVLGYSDYHARDDMTVLVAGVWKK